MTSSQRNDEAKSYWNHGYDTNSKSSLLLKDKWYDEEDRRKVTLSSKIVLVDQARNDVIEYKLASKEDY